MFITCLDIDFAEADPKANCEATWDKIEIFFRSNMAGLKDKTKSKWLKFTPKILHFTKRRGLLHFLPQPSHDFLQIYLPYL